MDGSRRSGSAGRSPALTESVAAEFERGEGGGPMKRAREGVQRIYEPSPFHCTPRCSLTLRPPSPRPPTCRRQLPRHNFRRHSPPMIAVQKPPALFASPAFRPMHSRHPSAPVVVRPSHTPGVLNLSKPAQPSPRPQHVQPQPRAPRASPKNKPQQRSPQPSHAQAAAPEKTKSPASSPAKADQPPSTTDKSPRGRKQNKQTKDAGRRLALPSTHVWRPSHR